MTPKSTPRYQWLDSWRGIACLMLVVYHALFYVQEPTGPLAGDGANFLVWLAKRMWVGVPIFFVISGYCIAGSIRSLQSKRGGLREFAVKRFLRIYPPLWAACAFTAMLWLVADTSVFLQTHCLQIKGAGDLSIWQWVGNLTVTESWLHHLVNGGTGPNYLMGIIWTLCYEEQFYLVAALALVLLKDRSGLGIAAMTAMATALFVTGLGSQSILSGTFLDGHWLLFAMGWSVHASIHQPGRWKKVGLSSLLLLSAILALLHMRGSNSDAALKFDLSIASAALFALLLIGAHPWDARLSGSRLTLPLSRIGRMSYSIYLTHYAPVTLMAGFFAGLGFRGHAFSVGLLVPLSLLISIGIGQPFYRWIERRFSSAPPRPSKPQEEDQILEAQKISC